jgi:hypothetical protein
VAQASSWLQQLLNSLGMLLALIKGRGFKLPFSYRFRASGGWLIVLVGIIAMLFWNWQLLLATGAGVLAMALVYLMQEWDWKPYLLSLRQFFSGSHRQLTLAVGSGGIATLTTYMAVSVWVDSDSPWIAAGAIVQGFGTLATFLLLAWQIIISQTSRQEAKQDQLLSDLTETDSVKRLLAVRRLTDWGREQHLHPSTRRIVADCLRLMLSQEPESIIRDAVLDGLMVLDNRQIAKSTQPFQTPIVLKQSPAKVKVHHIKPSAE